MRKPLLFIVVIVICILATACFREEPSHRVEIEQDENNIEQTGSIKLHVLTNRVDLIDNGGFEHYAAQFKEKHPNVEISFEGLRNYASDITAKLSTQNYGDVLLIPNDIKNQDLQGYFEPLSDELFENVRFADYKSYDGKRYGIASGSSSTGIVYNKKVFQEAGITEIPTTLEEFYEVTGRLKAAGKVPIYLNYGAQWPLMYWGEELISVMNGDPDYLNSLVDQDAPWQVDNEWGEVMSIVKFLIEHDYVESNLLSNQWEASKIEFVEDRVGMFFLGNWVITQLISLGADPDNIGFFPLPYSNEQPIYSPLNPDWFVAVSKYSANKEMAQEWIKFFIHESGFVNDSGFLPVDITKQPTLPQYKEFLSYGSIPVERQIPSDELLEIASLAEIRLWSGLFIQEWIAAPNLHEMFQGYNERWAEARKLIEH